MAQFLDREVAIQHVLHDNTPRGSAESDDDDGQVSAKAAGSGTGRRAAKGKRKLIYSDDESISLDDPCQHKKKKRKKKLPLRESNRVPSLRRHTR